MNTNNLASIIIPNYNHAHYLGDAIHSVLNQTYRPIEIIVVDDGSTDHSRDVVAQFGEPVRYIWQENQGLSAARNTGIRAAQGAYVGLLDADDLYEPDFLKTVVSLLGETPEADAVYCGYRFVDHRNKSLPQIEARQIPPERMFAALAEGNFLVPESMFVRRSCYEQVGLFDESLRALEDWDMWLRIANDHKIIGTDRVLTRHRILPGSMSTDPGRMLSNRLAVLQKQFGPEPERGATGDSLARRAYGRAYLTSSIEGLQYQDKVLADECLKKMAGVCPELLVQLDTFYQLGCGDQPKGSLGDFTSLNIRQNGEALFDMLGRLYSDPDLAAALKRYRRPAYAQANYALGLLSYGAAQLQQARRYLIKAIIADPAVGIEAQFMPTLLKSFLGTTLLSWLKTGSSP